MYAVIAIKGHQYIVKKGDEIVVDRIDEKKGKKVTFEDVLLTFNDDGSTVAIGQPTVKGASVTAKIKDHTKGEKLRVIKFQGKKRYKRTKGFRAYQTVLAIESV